MKPVDRYLNSVEFKNECYLEMREVARRAYLSGYADGAKGIKVYDEDVPVGHIRNVSVEMWIAACHYYPKKHEHSNYFFETLANFRNSYQIWADRKISSKRFAKELRELGFYVENINGTIMVDVHQGEKIIEKWAPPVEFLPF